jgi:hypothetical protein
VNAPASSTTIYVGKKDIPQGLSNILLFWMLHPLILSHVVGLFLFFRLRWRRLLVACALVQLFPHTTLCGRLHLTAETLIQEASVMARGLLGVVGGDRRWVGTLEGGVDGVGY